MARQPHLRSLPYYFIVHFCAPLMILILLFPSLATAQSRIKDIVDFEGVRDNMLVGYGLVVGLNGTGDGLGDSVFTRESLIGMLERLGVNARDGNMDAQNVAAVMVTATLPAFSRTGSRLDVQVSALGDSESLQGGTLLVTPLLGADGEVYAVAQGNIAISGFEIQGAAAAVTRGVPTSGRIANGGIIEREINFNLNDMEQVHLNLRNPDFTTARRISQAINGFLGLPASLVLDPGTIRLDIPPAYHDRLVDLMTDVEQLRIEPDQIARVVIDEQSGTIVMGENVRINQVAIAQGNLTIRVAENLRVELPQPFNNEGGVLEQDTEIDIQEDQNPARKLGVIDNGVSLQELVNGLNALGVGPRDMITILQAIKASGALQAEIEVM